MAFAVAVVLGEYQIPDLHIAVAVAADAAGGFAAAVFGAAVKVDLGAGAAGAGAVFPEVILFAQADDAIRRHAHFFGPNVERLIVILIDGYPQAVRRDLQHLGQKLPGPGSGFFFEVIAEREVAQHLKIGAVAGSVADVVDIRRADALLAGSDPAVWRGLHSKEKFFHGRHAGIDEQQALIVDGDQRIAGKAGMALTLEKREKLLAQLV